MSQSIKKAMKVLNLFSLERPEWSVSEASKTLNLPKSSTSELMSGLAEERLLSRTAAKGRYRLGWRLFELSQTLLDTSEFRINARKVMQELVRSWGETVHLAVLDGVQAVYIEKLQPTPAVKIRITRSGARLPAHATGVGKTLLAFSDWDRVATLFEDQGMPALTPNTICTLEELSEELEQVRERGYAYDHEESLIGLCCVAAPIRDSKEGETIAALSMSVPAYRFQPNEEDYREAILEAAQLISVDESSALEEYSGRQPEKQYKSEDSVKKAHYKGGRR